MKYLKLFEKIGKSGFEEYEEKQEFEEGDYVILTSYYFIKQGQVIKVKKIEEDFSTYFFYIVEIAFADNDVGNLTLRNGEIDRLMTPEEIEEYEMKKNSIKYNI